MGVVVGVAFLFIVALGRGWLVIGMHHREMMAIKDSALEKADRRAIEDARIIGDLTSAMTQKTASEEASAHLLQAVRDVVEGRDSRGAGAG